MTSKKTKKEYDLVQKEEPKEKSIGLFDMLSMIEGQKIPWKDLSDDYKKVVSQFMINRFISSKEVYIPLIAQLSELTLTDEQYYGILCDFISGNRKHYFDYKAYKKSKMDVNDELLEFAVRKEYEVGKREAKTIINKSNNEIKEQLRTKWKDVFENIKK